jgi:hypothetical protein
MRRSISADELADELLRRDLIEPDASAMPAPSNDRPWFISIVLGFSGWLAGGFLLGFVFVLFEPRSTVEFVIPGLVLLLAAFGLYAADRNNEFLEQLALALSIAGQVALTFAASRATDSEAATAALVAAMQVILLFVMPNALAKTIATFFACCAWALAIRFGWWGEPRYGARPHIDLAPALVSWFVVWIPIIVAARALVATERAWMAGGWRRIARPALTGLLLSLCVATWVSEPFSSLLLWEGDSRRRSNWLVLWPLLGAASALFASLYAFRVSNRALIGVAIVGALLYLAQFYYLLGTTLLTKSYIMVGVGVAALFAANRLRTMSKADAP